MGHGSVRLGAAADTLRDEWCPVSGGGHGGDLWLVTGSTSHHLTLNAREMTVHIKFGSTGIHSERIANYIFMCK